MANAVYQKLLAWLEAVVAVSSHSGISEKFIRFAIVGVMGFFWDTSTVYALRSFIGLYLAGVMGFLVAATANWGVNRIWTFRHHIHTAPHVQWMRFLIANSIGFVFNRGTFFALISISKLCHDQPVLPIIAGSIAGLGFNYFLSRRFVFS